jgi:hypothetical protein
MRWAINVPTLFGIVLLLVVAFVVYHLAFHTRRR